MPQINRPFVFFCLLGMLLVSGCSREIQLAGNTAQKVDFTGSWEVNHQLSESVQENARLLLLMADLQARRVAAGMEREWPVLPSMEVVELADSISQVPLLEIKQDDKQIEVRRGEEFPLTCTFSDEDAQAQVDSLATEICGWDDHQLVFSFRLPDNLHVLQVMTLGPAGKNLNIKTTVSARGRGQTFTLNRAYTKFEPLPDEFDCEYTLTRGKSCRRVSPDKPDAITL